MGFKSFFTGRQWRGRTYLISPFFDFMLSGGLAILTLVALFFLIPPHAPDYASRQLIAVAFMGWVAYALNDPHFMLSYQLLYRNYREKLRRFRNQGELWLRYIVAGIVAPVLMASYFLYALITHNMAMFSYAISAMLILVGWHYVKQAFGVFMMLSAMKKIYYGRWQRLFLLANSYIVWLCYSITSLTDASATSAVAKSLWGVGYSGMIYIHSPEWLNASVGMIFIMCALVAIIVAIWNRKNPSLTALIGYLSMYYLLFAASFHPLWILLYPAFHSLQYLMFVYAYKRGEMHSMAVDAADMRRMKRHLLGFVTLAIAMGAVFFTLLPGGLEMILNPEKTMILPITAAFIIFINIHHYFIDNVIWRRENADVGKYLFHRR